MVSRHRMFVAATVATLVGALPGPALAATTLGEVFTPTVDNTCAGSPEWEVFQTGRANGNSSTVPAPGVITSWTYLSGTQTTTLTMRVFRPTSAPSVFQVVADGGPMLGFPGGSGLHTVATRVPVQAGDLIGIHSTGGSCANNGAAGDTIRLRSGAATAVGATGTYSSNAGWIFEISAALEPDADRDGYGDETQDACPASALTQAACPAPETRIKGRVDPRAATTRLRLKSTVAGSTFTCTLDKGPAKACGAKLRLRCLKPGRHKLVAFATSPAGIADSTPATKRFRLAADRKGC